MITQITRLFDSQMFGIHMKLRVASGTNSMFTEVTLVVIPCMYHFDVSQSIVLMLDIFLWSFIATRNVVTLITTQTFYPLNVFGDS